MTNAFFRSAGVAAIVLMAVGAAWAGPYTEAGIAANDSRILGWATGISLTRGPTDITFPNGALASYGDKTDALGPADATVSDPYSVVSLGDGGSATLTFNLPIANGPGADFAVFENSFQEVGGGFYLELAFVEVSSNGTDFFRFPSMSLTPTTTQVGSFGTLDPTNIHNLAGKHTAGTGTMFDLSDLGNPIGLDLNNVHYVRVVDVVGSINPLYATHDSLGNVINDPWKTSFDSGGFDLDAVAVLNTVPEPGVLALLAVGAGCLWWRRRVRG